MCLVLNYFILGSHVLYTIFVADILYMLYYFIFLLIVIVYVPGAGLCGTTRCSLTILLLPLLQCPICMEYTTWIPAAVCSICNQRWLTKVCKAALWPSVPVHLFPSVTALTSCRFSHFVHYAHCHVYLQEILVEIYIFTGIVWRIIQENIG